MLVKRNLRKQVSVYKTHHPDKFRYIEEAITLAKESKLSKEEEDDDTAADSVDDLENEYDGTGIRAIEFLPANKRALKEKLIYSLGEYRAGNIGLRNQIVAIAEQLAKTKSLPKILKKEIKSTLNWIYDWILFYYDYKQKSSDDTRQTKYIFTVLLYTLTRWFWIW